MTERARGRALGAVLSGTYFAVSLFLPPSGRAQQQSSSRKVRRPTSTTTKVPGGKWYTFRGPDNDFTLDFPSGPKRVEDVQGPVTVLRRYALTFENIYFEVSIQDTGGAPGSPEANELSPKYEQNMAELLAEDGTKIVQIRRLSKGSYEMELWFPSLDKDGYHHGLRRGAIRNGRQYHYGCNSLIIGREVNRDVCRRFFNSFRIIGRPQ